MNTKPWSITTSGTLLPFLILSLVLSAAPALSLAQPGSMTRPMDDEMMERMMEERGYGRGYGYGQHGRMGPMGSMTGPMMMGPMGHMMGMLSGLDLNDKQREQIRALQRDMRKQHFAQMEKMMEASDKLEDLYSEEKPDAEKIGKVYDELYKSKRQMIQQHIEMRNKIYDILSKEQREKFKTNDPMAHRFGMMY